MVVSSSGIGSGLDIDNLISQLVAAEGQPAAFLLNKREFDLQTDLSALGTLKSALSDFQNHVAGLNNLSSFQVRTAISGNAELFTATANSSAVPGSYDVEVLQLASSAKVLSGDFLSETEVVGKGQLTITLGADSFQIDVDDSNKTLAGIRDSINTASDNPGVTASIINVDSGYRLVLTSAKTGGVNTLTVTADDDDNNDTDNLNLSRLASNNLTTIQSAQDAIFKIDQQQVTRDSNTVSDVISGVTFSLIKAEPGTVAPLNVDLNKSSVESKVAGFVEAYNSLIDTMKGLSSFNAETGEAAVLLGDSTLRHIQNQVRQIISTSVPGQKFSTLAEIGVTTDENGHLEVDSGKLGDVLSSNFDDIAQLFASENGLASQLNNALDRYLDSDGLLAGRTDGIQSRIDNISDDRERLERRLVALEARYRAQFTALDSLLSQLQTTSFFLGQQLASLPAANQSG